MQSMDLPQTIFLSHSSQDALFAKSLAAEIERVFSRRVKVFVSSRPDALESGKEWRPRVIENLGKASVLIVLLTRASENSAWVGFEAGYFWHKEAGKSIHILRHPEVSIPHPIDIIQAKLLTSPEEFKAFFLSLSQTLGYGDGLEPAVDSLVQMAETIEARIPERSLRYFEKMLDSSSWETLIVERMPTIAEIADLLSGNEEAQINLATRNEVWVCTDDVALQIVKDYSTKEKFTGEEWITKVPIYSTYINKDEFAYRYSVYLNIMGLLIKELPFISLDGERYFVPLPSIKPVSTDDLEEDTHREFFWRRDSLEYKVGLVIGEVYWEKSLERFARQVGIILE